VKLKSKDFKEGTDDKIKFLFGRYYATCYGEIINKYGRVLRQRPSWRGYPRVQLYVSNRKKWFVVHRLIARLFIENPNNYFQVNHIDGNKTNNLPSNLEWCTPMQNIRHALKNKLIVGRKIRVDQFTKDGKFIKTWDGIVNSSLSIGLGRTAVSSCIRGVRKTAGGFVWRRHDEIAEKFGIPVEQLKIKKEK